MSDFFTTGSDTFGSVLIYRKEQESRKKNYFITEQKNSSSREGLTVKTRFFPHSERLFLNDSKCKTITRG